MMDQIDDLVNGFNSFVDELIDSPPPGLYPDNDALEGLNENEKYFFHYCDFGKTKQVRNLYKKIKRVDLRIPEGYFKNSTPLMWASAKGHYEVVKFLIDNGADIQARCSEGKSVILWAAYNSCNTGVIKLLIEKGADINALDKSEKKTVLTMAIENCNCELARFLIEKGADIKKPNKRRSSGLIYAQKYQLTDIIELLKSKGAR